MINSDKVNHYPQYEPNLVEIEMSNETINDVKSFSALDPLRELFITLSCN